MRASRAGRSPPRPPAHTAAPAPAPAIPAARRTPAGRTASQGPVVLAPPLAPCRPRPFQRRKERARVVDLPAAPWLRPPPHPLAAPADHQRPALVHLPARLGERSLEFGQLPLVDVGAVAGVVAVLALRCVRAGQD